MFELFSEASSRIVVDLAKDCENNSSEREFEFMWK